MNPCVYNFARASTNTLVHRHARMRPLVHINTAADEHARKRAWAHTSTRSCSAASAGDALSRLRRRCALPVCVRVRASACARACVRARVYVRARARVGPASPGREQRSAATSARRGAPPRGEALLDQAAGSRAPEGRHACAHGSTREERFAHAVENALQSGAHACAHAPFGCSQTHALHGLGAHSPPWLINAPRPFVLHAHQNFVTSASCCVRRAWERCVSQAMPREPEDASTHAIKAKEALLAMEQARACEI
eukprot:177140-Pleurochrysis_carterae.AAC.2